MAGLRIRGRLHRPFCALGNCASGRSGRISAQRFPIADREGQHRHSRYERGDEGRPSSRRALPLPDWIQRHPPRPRWKRRSRQLARLLKSEYSARQSRDATSLPERSQDMRTVKTILRRRRASPAPPAAFQLSRNASTERQYWLQWNDASQRNIGQPLLGVTGSLAQ